MTDPRLRRVSSGYLGVVLAVICAVLFSSLGLYKGLSSHQADFRQSLLSQVIESGRQTNVIDDLIFRRVAPATLSNNQQSLPAALTRLKDLKSDTILKDPTDKPWFDAYWQPKTRWIDGQGRTWATSAPSFEGQRSARLIARLSPALPPKLPWLLLISTACLSLLLALLSCYFLNGNQWLVLASPLSSVPLVISLLWILSRVELQTHLPLQGATLIPMLALLPMIILGGLQSITGGNKSVNRVAYTYMAPALVSVGLLVFIPFSIGVTLSFMRHDQGLFEWVGLSHFINILSASDYPLSHPLNFYFTLLVTLFWTFSNVVLHTSIGLSLALLLNRKGLKLRAFYRALLIIPWAIPNYITALIWKGMYNQQYGLINQVLEVFGIESVSWMGSFWGAMAANISTNTWLGFPFMMVVTLGALQSIPTDLYEAAEIAGASKWQIFRSITLPLLKPALLPAIILGSVWTFNMFNIIYLVSGGQPGGSTDILITEAYRWAFEQDRYGYAAAYSLIIFFILLAYARLTQRMSQTAEEVYR